METVALRDILWSIFIPAASIVVYMILFSLLKKEWGGKKRFIPQLLQTYLYKPGFLLILILAFNAVLELNKQKMHLRIYETAHHLIVICEVISAALIMMRVVTVMREVMLNYYHVREHDEYEVRKTKTKFQIMQRVFNFLIALATIAIVLMTFKNVRQVGSTLLASAGVLGLVLGFAAQKSLGTLFAGIQIAVAQPIRLDDVVVVEGQFGTIGEITLTYVVVYRWDGRRLVVPINYFLEKSFESWTRSSPEVVGKVKIYADYTLPIQKLREEFKSWIENSELWDRRKSNLLVTGAGERTIEVRATMSAKDSDDAWDLECMIREKLITYIQQHHPESLPHLRLAMKDGKDNDQPENFIPA